MISFNIDTDGLLPQIEFYHLGGIKTILGRLSFYVGFFNLVLLVPTAYNSSPALRTVFPNVLVFAVVIAGLLGVAVVVEFAVVYPSQLKFSKEQASRNQRDPIYREASEANRRLDRIEAHLGVGGEGE